MGTFHLFTSECTIQIWIGSQDRSFEIDVLISSMCDYSSFRVFTSDNLASQTLRWRISSLCRCGAAAASSFCVVTIIGPSQPYEFEWSPLLSNITENVCHHVILNDGMSLDSSLGGNSFLHILLFHLFIFPNFIFFISVCWLPRNRLFRQKKDTSIDVIYLFHLSSFFKSRIHESTSVGSSVYLRTSPSAGQPWWSSTSPPLPN